MSALALALALALMPALTDELFRMNEEPVLLAVLAVLFLAESVA
jgi:hypothetical protein